MSLGIITIVHAVLAVLLIIELGLTGYGKSSLSLLPHQGKIANRSLLNSRQQNRLFLLRQHLPLAVQLHALQLHLVAPHARIPRLSASLRGSSLPLRRRSRHSRRHHNLLVRRIHRHGRLHWRAPLPRQ